MHLSVLLLCVLGWVWRSEGRYTNRQGKETIVLAAPSIWDQHYRSKFFDIINFQIDFVESIMGWDNVVVLADKHTLPYLDGRSNKIKKKLPRDVLIQANVYDIHLKDFAPMGLRRIIKYGYETKGIETIAAYQIDMSMKRLLQQLDIGIDKYEKEVVVSGTEVVDNGSDKAIFNEAVVEANAENVPDWALMIKLLNAFKSIAIVKMPNNSTMATNDTTTRLSDIISFIDQKHLLVSMLSDDDMADLDGSLWKKFRDRVTMVEVPTHYTDDSWGDKTGVCGLYSAVLATSRTVYVPSFGNDPENWKMGHSTMMDKMAGEVIQVNTLKKMIRVNVPKTICEMGTSLSSLAWKVDGLIADKIVKRARFYGRRRFLTN